MINYYELLNIPREASKTAIIKAGKALMKAEKDLQTKNPKDLPSQKLVLLNDALETLSDEEGRKSYDEELNYWFQQEAEKKEDKIDFSKYLLDSTDDWRGLCDDWEGDPVGAVQNIFDYIIDLRNFYVYRPLMLSFLLTPSAMSTALPVVFCWGKSGAGKSQPCKFAAALWGCEMLLSSSTYVSMRNDIQKYRWDDPVMSRGERNYILAWDDISKDKMASNPDLYTFLKGGYSRSSSTIKIAAKDGANISFNVFGGRIISSIHPFFSDPKYSELKRRMLIFPMKKSDRAITDFDEIDWRGANKLTFSIWSNRDNLEAYANNKRKVRLTLKKGHDLISIDRANLITDILTTGVTLGLFKTVEEAIEIFAQSEELTAQLSEEEQDNTTQVIELIVREFERDFIAQSKKIYIKPSKLKEAINHKVRNGELDGHLKRGELPALMKHFGYKLNPDLGAWIKAEH
jgi:curved DNA-binding protein CbpA